MNALKNSDKDNFEVAFHEVERKLLASAGGCVLKVVKLMKYLRDSTGGTLHKLKSHFIKVKLFYKLAQGAQGRRGSVRLSLNLFKKQCNLEEH